MLTNNVIGRPVIGGDFFDRKREQQRIWRRLESDNILLLAPRRVGKTSLLQRLEDTADEHEAEAVHVSVADRAREIDFIVRLYEAIAKRERGAKAIAAALTQAGHKTSLRKLELAGVFTAEFTNAEEDRWQELGDALMSVLQQTDRQWVIMVDELPLFVLELLEHSRARARAFLKWFRSIRTDQQAGLCTRWILAGSIGLDTVVSRERLGDTINDLAVESLGAFSEEDADRFLVALAKSHEIVLRDEVRAHTLQRIDWLIPFHLQLIFSAIVDRDVHEPGTEDVDAAYQSLLEPARKSHFDWWVQRLPDELGKADAAHAREVIAAVARDIGAGVSRGVLTELLRGRGVDDDEHHRFLLDALQNDGYLVQVDRRYHFRSPLLRDFWRARVLP